MVEELEKMKTLLSRLVASKHNLTDTLVDKGEEADFSEPFDDLVQKAADYIPKSYIFVDDTGNETTGILVDQLTVFDANENDVREGKTFANQRGVNTGEKYIPSYHTTEGSKYIEAGSDYTITLIDGGRYDYTKLQVIVCAYNDSMSDSVSAEKVSINSSVYEVNSVEPISEVTKDHENMMINLNIINDTNTPKILRYFTYKEIE